MKKELYCQSPYCGEIISEKQNIAEVNGNLVHDTKNCIEGYMMGECFRTRDVVICSSIGRFSYNKAQKLAEKNKVKFSKLEKETASVGGMGQ